jgi:hypothetical protein
MSANSRDLPLHAILLHRIALTWKTLTNQRSKNKTSNRNCHKPLSGTSGGARVDGLMAKLAGTIGTVRFDVFVASALMPCSCASARCSRSPLLHIRTSTAVAHSPWSLSGADEYDEVTLDPDYQSRSQRERYQSRRRWRSARIRRYPWPTVSVPVTSTGLGPSSVPALSLESCRRVFVLLWRSWRTACGLAEYSHRCCLYRLFLRSRSWRIGCRFVEDSHCCRLFLRWCPLSRRGDLSRARNLINLSSLSRCNMMSWSKTEEYIYREKARRRTSTAKPWLATIVLVRDGTLFDGQIRVKALVTWCCDSGGTLFRQSNSMFCSILVLIDRGARDVAALFTNRVRFGVGSSR